MAVHLALAGQHPPAAPPHRAGGRPASGGDGDGGGEAVLQVQDFTSTMQLESQPDRGDPDQLPPVGSMTMDEIERAVIAKSLAHHGGNLSRVAESLGLSRAALYRRLEKYGIRP